MNGLFQDLISREVVVIYLDNILIFIEILEEHCIVRQEVLKILRQNKLYLKPEKYKFEVTQTEYLGMIISKRHIAINPVKIKSNIN